jgi:hypothetical protein
VSVNQPVNGLVECFARVLHDAQGTFIRCDLYQFLKERRQPGKRAECIRVGKLQPLDFGHERGHIFECGANHQVVVDLRPGPTAMYRVKRSLRTGPDGGKFFGRHTSILAAGSAA